MAGTHAPRPSPLPPSRWVPCLLGALWLSLCAAPAMAQESAPAPQALAESVRAAGLEFLAGLEPVGEAPPVEGRLARLLEGIQVDFQGFETNREAGASLGVRYSILKSVLPVQPDLPVVQLLARGNLAFDQGRNPDDFLETGLRLRWSQASALGPRTPSARAAGLPMPTAEELAALDPARYERLVEHMDGAGTSDLSADADFGALVHDYSEGLRQGLSPWIDWDFDLHAVLESTQDLSSNEFALGGSVSARYVSLDPDSRASRMNPFDVPAAIVRWLAGQDESFRTTGEAWPRVVLGLDVVDASGNDLRRELTDDRAFLRTRLEMSLASRVVRVAEQDLYLAIAWRSFAELSAPVEVREAHEDAKSLLEFQLDLPGSWFLRCSTGKLPLDGQYDTTYALGYSVTF